MKTYNIINMKKVFILTLSILFFACSSSDTPEAIATPTPVPTPTPTPTPVVDSFIRGVDISYIPTIENAGTTYKNNGVNQDPLLTLKNAGCNTVRIRIWNNPATGAGSGLAEVKALAARAKLIGLKIWITVHYSDTWADPGHQTTPAAWSGLNFNDLKTAAVNYTSTILTEVQPDIIQIGNEINSGLLWPQAHLINNESQCIQLLSALSAQIRTQAPTTKIMIHYAGVGSGASWFFNKMSSINYDYIGLSYYAVWHGKNLSDITSTINTLGTTHNKKVIIAETSYPFTLGWNDWTNNVVGLDNQLIPAYPATNEGQKNYILAIKSLVKQSPNGIGFCYWGGEWVAFRGNQATNGSSWENQALWDFNFNALPAMSAFSQN